MYKNLDSLNVCNKPNFVFIHMDNDAIIYKNSYIGLFTYLKNIVGVIAVTMNRYLFNYMKITIIINM